MPSLGQIVKILMAVPVQERAASEPADGSARRIGSTAQEKEKTFAFWSKTAYNNLYLF